MKVDRLQQWQRRSGHRDQFPTKLYTMLELAGARGPARSPGTVAWLPHGRAFRILDEEGFVDAVAPLFFRLTKIRSFHRQLHLWGFKRASAGIDAGAWYHESFVRGSPGEIRKMIRTKVKGRLKPGNPPDDREEPRFCTMPPLAGGRRVSVEKIPAVDGDLFDRNLANNLERLVLPEPELSGRASSPNSALSPVLPNLLHGDSGILDGGRRAPSATQFYRDGPRVTPPLASSGVADRKLGRRSKYSAFPTDDDKSLLAAGRKPSSFGASFGSAAAGTNHFPVGISSEEEVKRILTAGLEPLPFGGEPAASEAKRTKLAGVGSAMIPSDNEEKRRLTAGLEPLPFGEPPVDEFANYIDGAIQIL